MKLELKHIVPYLPYGLKIMTDYDGVQEVSSLPDFYHVSYYNKETDAGDDPHIKSVRPILHSLSDLTQDSKDYMKFSGDACLSICEESHLWNLTESWSYDDVSKLFELHYDVFGLIEKGLAIDKNTL